MASIRLKIFSLRPNV